MKKLFTLFLALAAGVGTMFARTKIGELYYNLNATDKTAEVAYNGAGMSVTDNSLADWNLPPDEYVAEATCPAGAAMTGLKSVKVFADTKYIYILVEPNMDVLPDLEWLPFHIYLDTDNSDATGGYGDLFTDANSDVMLENALFVDGNPNNYNPSGWKWWGEVGESGWLWTDPNVAHDQSDCWGAIVCETEVLVGASQYVDGKFEIRIDRTLIPVTWNTTEFGIGLEIQQNWAVAGVLPCAAATEENPNGKVAKMKVKVADEFVQPSDSHAISGNVVIPASVSYESTTYSVTSIGESAFEGCSGLTSVTIPNSVTSIGKKAFDGCSGLTSVTLNSNAVVSQKYNLHSNIGNIFGSQVTEYIIGEGVTSIGWYAFSICSSLTSVTIPNSVTSIGGGAFISCIGLTSVTIPNSVTSIGDGAFYGCSGLTSVDAPAAFFDVREGSRSYYTKILRQVKVNSGELTENALLFIKRSNKTLQTLDVSGVTNTEFADEAFKDCYNLQVLVLPEGLQKVGYMMVAGCKNLQAIDIPASVEEIEQSAFEDCRSIKSITFGGASSGAPGRFNAPAASSQLKKIGNWAFYNCHALQNIVIPEGVEEIGDGAFYGCTYLADVSIPASARIIGDNAFALCSKMAKMTVGAVVPPAIAAKTFEEVSRAMPVYVPETSVSAYKADPLWGQMNIIGSETAVETIGVAPAATKFLRNGEVLILRDGKMYNLQGVEVK